MKFSVVVPSFNQGRFLEQTIRSVVEQRTSAVELVVRDGGSNDESVSILKRYDASIASWVSKPDGGQTAALNAGMSVVSGDYVGWLNSDDYYLPGAFEAAAERFAAPDRPDVVFGYSVTVDQVGRVLRENRHDDFSLEALATLGMDVNQQAMFWRRELCDRVFPLDESLRFCMDLQFLVRLAESGARFGRLPCFMGAFRLHGESKTSNWGAIRRAEEDRLLGELRESLVRAGGSPRRRLVERAARRLRFASRGELAYALTGGTRPSREAMALAESAGAWAGSSAAP
jgi:glycosyltransferase involved in cell wall biosynthesis